MHNKAICLGKIVGVALLWAAIGLAQVPPPIIRNSWTTNIPPRRVLGNNNLSVTNVGSGTNWDFFGISPNTVARLSDVAGGAVALIDLLNCSNDLVTLSYVIGADCTNHAEAILQSATNYAADTANNVSNWVNAVSNRLDSFSTANSNQATAVLQASTNYAAGTANNVSNWVNAVSNRLDSFSTANSNHATAVMQTATNFTIAATNGIMPANGAGMLTNDGAGVKGWMAIPSGGASPTTTQGDMIVRGASVDERLPVGPAAGMLTSDGTDPFWLDKSYGLFIADSFSTGASIYGLFTASSSGGSTAYVVHDPFKPDRFGLQSSLTVSTNSGAFGRIYGGSGTTVTNLVIGTNVLFEALIGFATTTITDTNSGPAVNIWTNTAFVCGFGNSLAVESSVTSGAGFAFRWNGANTESNIFTWTKLASSRTTNVTAYIPVTNGWYKLKIAGSTNSLVFSINDVVVATHTDADNTPVGAGLIPFIQIASLTSDLSFTNRKWFYCDYVKVIER